jgi:TRAP-type C4-dicarboxylate transport system permease small subunit
MDQLEHDGEEAAGAASPLSRLGSGIMHAADAVCAAMFVGVFLIFSYKIARRYVPPQDAVAWADEVSVILFIWIVFIANAFIVDDRRQISFDLIHRNLSARGQRVIEIIRMLLVGGIFAAAVAGAFDYILFLWRERTPVLQLRLDYVYICFGIFMLAVLARYAVRTAGLLLQRKL